MLQPPASTCPSPAVPWSDAAPRAPSGTSKGRTSARGPSWCQPCTQHREGDACTGKPGAGGEGGEEAAGPCWVPPAPSGPWVPPEVAQLGRGRAVPDLTLPMPGGGEQQRFSRSRGQALPFPTPVKSHQRKPSSPSAPL